MLRRSLPCLFAAALAASSLAQEAVEKVAAGPPAPAPATAQARAVPGHGFVLEAGDLALEDLVDAAAQFLNRNILFAPAELQGGGGKGGATSVRLQNRMELDALGCEEMLTTLLYSRGFALTPLDAGRNVYEVIAMFGPRGKEVASRAVSLSPDEILRRPMLRIMVMTSVDMQHINAPVAVNALRPFYGASGNAGTTLQLGNAGNNRSLLLQGFSDQVAAAIRMLRDCDKPSADQPPDLTQRLQQIEQQVQALAQLSQRVQQLEQQNHALQQALVRKAEKQ